MTNIITQTKQLTSDQPWWVVLLLLLILLVLAIGWAAHKCTIAMKTFTATKAEANNMITFFTSLLKAPIRPMVLLSLVVFGALIFAVWSSGDQITRTSILMMMLYGNIFFLIATYLAVDIFFVIAAHRLEKERKQKS